jgi:acyl-CoA thioesterase
LTVENAGIEKRLFDYLVESINSTPFYQLLDLKITRIGPGFTEFKVVSGERHTNPLGVIHGGLIMSLADAAMANAIRSLGIKGVTVDCSTSLTAGAMLGEDVIARGEVLKAGNSMLFAEARVWADDRLLANAKASFFKTGDYDFA